jgi:hypothetical protein
MKTQARSVGRRGIMGAIRGINRFRPSPFSAALRPAGERGGGLGADQY